MFKKQTGAGTDMLSGPLAPNLLRFAIPLACTGILQQLFNAADLAVVGQFVGKEAMAAVGSNSPVISLLVNLFIGISVGTNIVIAQASGRGDEAAVVKAVHTSVVLAVLSGAVMAVLGQFAAAPAITLLGVPDDVFAMALTYLRIYLCGLPVILLYNFEAAIFRSRGDSATPLMALFVSGIANVLLNLFFVLVLHMAVAGVALATVLSNLISSAVLFVFLLRTEDRIRVIPRQLRMDGTALKDILTIGVPAGLQSMMFSLANLVVQSAVNSLGSTVMAGSSAAFNVEIISWYVLNAYAQACSTFVGQNYGAGQLDRCRRILFTTLWLDYLCVYAVFVPILLCGRTILSLFNPDAEVISVGMVRLLYIALTYVFSIPEELLSGYLRGYGNSRLPALISMAGICGVRLCWIFFVFPKAPSFGCIMQAFPVSLAVTAVVITAATAVLRPSRRMPGESL